MPQSLRVLFLLGAVICAAVLSFIFGVKIGILTADRMEDAAFKSSAIYQTQ